MRPRNREARAVCLDIITLWKNADPVTPDLGLARRHAQS